MEEKILTLHPDGKQGVNISKEKYDIVRQAILSALGQQQEILFKDLPGEVERAMDKEFDGSISWYVTSIKLDLEARGLIVRLFRSEQATRLRLA